MVEMQKERERKLILDNGTPDKKAWEAEEPNVKRKGGWVSTRQLTLARWDSKQSAHVGNLVLMTEDEADALDEIRSAELDGEKAMAKIRETWPSESTHIEDRLREAQRMVGASSWNGGSHWRDTSVKAV